MCERRGMPPRDTPRRSIEEFLGTCVGLAVWIAVFVLLAQWIWDR